MQTLYITQEIFHQMVQIGGRANAGGGSSGGGSINIFAKIVAENGNQTANRTE